MASTGCPSLLLPGRRTGDADLKRYERLTGPDTKLKEPRVLVADGVACLEHAGYEVEWNEEHAARWWKCVNRGSTGWAIMDGFPPALRIAPDFA